MLGHCNCPQKIKQFCETSQPHCGNSVIQACDFPKLEAFSTSQCGKGLRVLEFVPKDSIIVEYLGEVITPDECKDRMSYYESTDDFYFAALENGYLLDAKSMGSVARFANHSCSPTCSLQKWHIRGECRIALVANHDLQPNDEVTYNYQYFNDGFDGLITRQVCHCNSIDCCGTIGGRVIESPWIAWKVKANALLQNSRKASLSVWVDHLNAIPCLNDDKGLVEETAMRDVITLCNNLVIDLSNILMSTVLVS